MPKAILQFNLPEEREEFELATKAAQLSCSVDDFDNYLRSIIKYDHNISEERRELYQEIRDKFWEIVKDNE